MLLDPGMDLTLRPMRYPHFYDRYRDAIKNTWTVEEVDLHSDLSRPAAAHRRPSGTWSAGWWRSSPPATRSSPTTWCSTSTSTSTPPRAGSTCRRQLFEEAVHVQFYLTLLDTYVPDEQRAARGVRRGREHPVDQGARPSSASGGSTRSSSSTSCETRERPAGVPAQPDLLRRLHRGPVLLRRVRLRLLPAVAGPAQRARLRHQLGVPRRVDAHGVRLRRGRHRARARSRTCSTTSWPRQVARR